MSTFEIDHYHLLSAYHVDEEKGVSVMNSAFKKMLFRPKVLDGVFEPFELKKTFEIWFELELMTILAKITKSICEFNHISLSDKNIICKDIHSPFAPILGVDEYNYGWNIYGLLLSKEKEQPPLEKDQYFYMIDYLLSFFKTNHHFQPFYHCSDEQIYKMIKDEKKRALDKKHFKMKEFEFQEFEVDEIYKWCKLYENSVLYIIQKIYQGRIPTWENENILKEIKRFVHRKLHLPDMNDLRCNNNLLHLYYNDKLKLPIDYQRTIEVIENKRKTLIELQSMKQYSPSFLKDNVVIVDKNHLYHLEYPRTISLDNFTFPNILQCIHYKLLCIYHPKNVAFQKSSSLNIESWDMTLKEYFKKHFHRLTFEKMNGIQYRLALLQTESKDIINKDTIDFISGMGENFLGKMLMDIRSEMKDYLTDENRICQETILYFLNQWIELWKDSEILEEDVIRFYFELYFSNFNPKKTTTDIIFPISLQNTDNHDIIHGYFKDDTIPNVVLEEEKLMSVFGKRMDETTLDFMKKKWSKFAKFHKGIMKHFRFTKKEEIVPFEEQKELTFKKYIVYKHYFGYD